MLFVAWFYVEEAVCFLIIGGHLINFHLAATVVQEMAGVHEEPSSCAIANVVVRCRLSSLNIKPKQLLGFLFCKGSGT